MQLPIISGVNMDAINNYIKGEYERNFYFIRG